MKKSGQILNSPVISIQEGREVGMVRELVVNPDKKSVEFLLVEKNEGGREGEILAIPFREAIGVGEYAVTIEHQRVLMDLSKMNIAGSLLDNRVHVIDERVITRKGKLLGTITDYMIDPETGSIPVMTLVTEEGKKETEILLETIVSIGQQLVIVSDEADESMPSEGVAEPVAADENPAAPVVGGDVLLDQMTNTEEPEPDDITEEMGEDGSSVEMFISRQKSFLMGKELKQDLKDSEGNVIAASGTEVTPDIFDKVQQMGRQKVIELTMLTE